jgi:DNA-binding NtrC family response regulator
MDKLSTDTPPQVEEGSLFEREILGLEKKLIAQALADEGGSVTRAARRLGLSHQSLLARMNSPRHKDSSFTRTPIRKRRKRIMEHPPRAKKGAAS